MVAAAFLGGWSIAEVLIAVVVIAAACALVWVALRQFGIAIPAWAIQCLWICVVAVVVVVCIRFLMTL